MPDTLFNTDEGTDTQPTYRHGKRVPSSVLDACLYALGYQQWLSPNADSEYASECRRTCQGIYAAVLLAHGQYNRENKYFSEPEWGRLRMFRDSIFEQYFYAPAVFELTEFDTPDEMFDAVESELVAHDLLHDVPPDREEEYVEADLDENPPPV